MSSFGGLVELLPSETVGGVACPGAPSAAPQRLQISAPAHVTNPHFGHFLFKIILAIQD